MEWAAKQGIAAGATAIVAGGGDGTISTVAAVPGRRVACHSASCRSGR